ncbi:hypothetical protein [Nocardioides marmorisolisilvae]|uniref:hypothetical protein n=1 Tax=Nocardioides marmorisolisilvae TaxID=1542737 RepID=UPI0011CE801B|nr:hypothetical protein [Nocardioides marmorisolisilvae]
MFSGRLTLVALLAIPVLTACGSKADPAVSQGDPVDATPRALAAVLIDHVHGSEPRRETGSWSDYDDPLSIGAQVDYGVDPEGSESGPTRTVRIEVGKIASYAKDERAFLTCRDTDERCEQHEVDGVPLVFRWDRGAEEEEPGTYSWTVVREDEVVRVAYEGSGLFSADPRTVDLTIDPDDLRAAALDPAMSLRTTTGAIAAGAVLKDYSGPEHSPAKPVVRASTPAELAEQFEDLAQLKATSVKPSTRTEFGPDAVGAHLSYPGTDAYEPFTVDVLTTVGTVPQLDPPPCAVQSQATARHGCFGLDEHTYVTWTLAEGDRPGVLWIISSQENEDFNRVESSGIRFQSTGLTQNFYTDATWTARFPLQVWSNVLYLTFRPEIRIGQGAG